MLYMGIVLTACFSFTSGSTSGYFEPAWCWCALAHYQLVLPLKYRFRLLVNL